mmetsp:Transcript_80283/g.215182  ORF Transcript_80283/g.215182 Transcript_80283/m.215182 type:complete len:203 (-) Transcript_80283:22-630(-)
MDGLDHGGKSIGGARCTRDEILRSIILALIHTHNNGLGIILSRGRVDDLLGTSINDSLGFLLGEEDASRLAHIFSSLGSPANFRRITTPGGGDLLAVDHKEVTINLDSSLGNTVDGIIFVLVSHVISGGGTSIDSVTFNIGIVHHNTGHKTSDTSKTVNTHAGGHGKFGITGRHTVLDFGALKIAEGSSLSDEKKSTEKFHG